MKDARFTSPTPALLSRVDMLDGIDLHDRDTNGDLYEYMLSKTATAGTFHGYDFDFEATSNKKIVENQKLDAVVKLPSGVVRPYAGVSTAILFFTKTDSGGTDDVWIHDVRADGFPLDDKRNSVEENDLPDVLQRWVQRTGRRP